MPYTLEEFSAECHAALKQDPGPRGRKAVSLLVQKAALDADFLARHVPADQAEERNVLYEDPELKFCILAHVYRDAKNSAPHDHGPTWAIYGQAEGTTEMTDFRVLEKPHDGQPGKAQPVHSYSLTPGTAHVYNEGVVHAPRRDGPTRLIRIEGFNLHGRVRDKFEAVA